LDEIPFFDTNFLCEPAQPTHFTSYEDEIEPWDAPLRRRTNVSSHISSHLYHGNRRDSHYSDIGSEDGMLVNEPFNRDPNVPLKKIKARKYDVTPRPSLVPMEDQRPVCYSPTPYSKPSVGNLRAKFTEGDDAKVFKKRSAPKPPSATEDQLEQRPVLKKVQAPNRPNSPFNRQKSDPIREMEQIGKKEVCISSGRVRIVY
jgi:myosin III